MTKPEAVLTATLIVRDEEQVLSACLASLRPLCDEIVVVDTGSVDRSVAIATEHGAKVCHFRWRDDFSVARNFAIEQASCPWFLYIDADERVRAGDHTAVRAALSQTPAIAARVRFYPRTGFTAYNEYRIFRRDSRLRFQGVVHESILPSINDLIAAEGATIVDCDLTIDHIGYDGPHTHKTDRYLRLLNEAIKTNPKRVYLWWHLGCVHRDRGDLEQAEARWRHGAALAIAQGRSNGDDVLCHIELINRARARGDDALALIEEGCRLRPDNYLLQRFKAISLMERGSFAEAAAHFAGLAQVDPDTLIAENAYDKRIFGLAAAQHAAECAFRAGLYRDAAHWYGVAERALPNEVEFRTKRLLAEMRNRNAGQQPPAP